MSTRKAVFHCNYWAPERKEEVLLREDDSTMLTAIKTALMALVAPEIRALFCIPDNAIPTITLVAKSCKPTPDELEVAACRGVPVNSTERRVSLNVDGHSPLTDYLTFIWEIEIDGMSTGYSVSFIQC